ncbi:NAD-dependent deacylase [Alisedimentitalea sp. MJ-SS2]|uniref:NAD-dependent deacylase n=1 Tax=Aliisedimentitalea sp. MJ-SS2 TaxID=3049795 RepID=UPI0029083B67|nr:NAD-dependent deacylase [Alisedimentitalea sp. MJ-SS2]MDU8929872.1 NAD-dependent deacylase [Alisedimentitalea sp. MJ-SS2]
MSGKIVILTGAGISAESGLGTFRDVDGLWTQYDLNEVATPEGFERNPKLVLEFYNARRANCLGAAPNAAHEALARLQEGWAGEVVIVTQNVDDLHERGGARDVIHMHGQLDRALCADCGHRWDAPKEMFVEDACPKCSAPATRPDIVWFGEIPYAMDGIMDHLAGCETFVAIGTSGEVYPAAGFVHQARAVGARTVEINLEPSSVVSAFEETWFGPATEKVPEWVGRLLG